MKFGEWLRIPHSKKIAQLVDKGEKSFEAILIDTLKTPKYDRRIRAAVAAENNRSKWLF